MHGISELWGGESLCCHHGNSAEGLWIAAGAGEIIMILWLSKQLAAEIYYICWDLFLSSPSPLKHTHTQFQSSRSLPVKCCFCIFLMRCFRYEHLNIGETKLGFHAGFDGCPAETLWQEAEGLSFVAGHGAVGVDFLHIYGKLSIYIIYNTYNYIYRDIHRWFTILTMVIFPSYVRLPEGILYKSDIIFIPPPTWRIPSLVK